MHRFDYNMCPAVFESPSFKCIINPMTIYNLQFEDGALPEPHEIQTALFLSKQGKKIIFIAPIDRRGIKTPDIIMDGYNWEIKSPQSSGARTIEHAIRSASRQSSHIIVDLRRSKLSTLRALSQIKFHALKRTNITKLLVITLENKLVDIK